MVITPAYSRSLLKEFSPKGFRRMICVENIQGFDNLPLLIHAKGKGLPKDSPCAEIVYLKGDIPGGQKGVNFDIPRGYRLFGEAAVPADFPQGPGLTEVGGVDILSFFENLLQRFFESPADIDAVAGVG
jgi:hypothetical protein